MPELNYQDLVETYPKVKAVLPENVMDAMKDIDKKTHDHLGDLWTKNLEWNVKKNLPKYGWLNDGFIEIGKQKAVIAIGAGPSLNRNVDYLKMISLVDGTRPFEEQDYILMASNHQLKPCLEKGIIPHFGMLVDASPDLVKQVDVDKELGKSVILIASIVTSPDVIDKWPGSIKFILQSDPFVKDKVDKILDKTIDKRRTFGAGGNILNLSFMIGFGLFRASVWMCVGNDLSFPVKDNIEDSRDSYYADKDYFTNIISKRDEARHKLSWGGFEFPENKLEGMNYINLNLVHTSPQMFHYKTWLEMNSIMLWDKGAKFKIYNCSESGILGVLLKEDARDAENYDKKFDLSNWALMDDLIKGRWRTRTLQQATEEFHKAKEILQGELCPIIKPPGLDVLHATNLVTLN